MQYKVLKYRREPHEIDSLLALDSSSASVAGPVRDPRTKSSVTVLSIYPVSRSPGFFNTVDAMLGCGGFMELFER